MFGWPAGSSFSPVNEKMRVFKLFIKYIIRLGPLNFFDYLYQRFIKKKKLLQIKVPGLGDTVAVRNHTSDIPLFANIFMLREYNVPLAEPVKTIIDCGANIGLASLYFISEFPNAKIIAIEPEGNNYHLLKRNLKSYKNVTCINKGVWSTSTNLEVINTNHGNHAFMVKESAISSERSIKAISIGDIINEFQLSEIDILKIDRTFINSMRENKKDLNLVTGIVALAHNLGLKVVAEGVEHIEELKLLRIMSVEYIQGYYFSRPLSFEAACYFLTENQISALTENQISMTKAVC